MSDRRSMWLFPLVLLAGCSSGEPAPASLAELQQVLAAELAGDVELLCGAKTQESSFWLIKSSHPVDCAAFGEPSARQEIPPGVLTGLLRQFAPAQYAENIVESPRAELRQWQSDGRLLRVRSFHTTVGWYSVVESFQLVSS